MIRVSPFSIEERSCLLFCGSSCIHTPQGTRRPRTHDGGGFPLVNWQLALCFSKISDLLWSDSWAACFSWQVTYTSDQLRLWIIVESSDNFWRSGFSFVDPHHHRRLNCCDATWQKAFEPHAIPHHFHHFHLQSLRPNPLPGGILSASKLPSLWTIEAFWN